MDTRIKRNNHKGRILVISPWESMWSLGGNAGVSDDYRFIEKFTSHGYELHFLIPKGDLNDQPVINSHHIHTYPNFFRVISVFPTPAKRVLLSLLFNLIVFPKAIRLARTIHPDFVLGHTHFTATITFALRKLQTVHAGVKLFGVMDLVHTEWPRWKYLFKNFEQIIALKFPQDLWIVLDDGTRGGEMLLRQGIDKEKIHFLPNGINIEWADQSYDVDMIRKEMGIPSDVCVVLFLARLVKSKRPEAVIQAIPPTLRLARREVLFVFAGDGSSRSKCEALAGRLGVRRYTRFLGVIPHAEVPKVFSSSDIFVSTSNLTNMSIPTCEASLCGIPVVAFDVGDTRKVVRNGETGFAVKDGDIDALARSIADLVNNDEERKAMGRRAKRFAMDHFTSWDERTNQELEIIDRWVQKA